MSPTSRLLRLARWIGGKERADWSSAMEAEAAYDGGDGTNWAIGCVIAALRDRVGREGKFLLAIALAPIATLLFCLFLFLAMSEPFMTGRLPSWFYNLAMLLAPLPFAWFLGRSIPSAAIVAGAVSFSIFTIIPWIQFWIQIGQSPLIWFVPNAEAYGMPTIVGLGCSLLIWVGGAWLGSRRTRVAV
ncbi:MAG: hypothetical protein M3Q83_02365 [Pseudomonadota bacterium]|nr:hypothetical protein [Pseudomonadota bacterium]